ncbi:helix-turn-helix domain-containing protein [Bdellovibrio sp. BCCA]|uniref:helix-turn-helix domain-containing protein n=1 Tax=Bdellovibrio sp. BCCA TaxID=3136281 RepID=UPI0030F163EA
MAKNLKRVMLERGLSVADLERRSKVSRKTLYHWMGGQKPRNIEQVFSVCDALQISIDSLYGRQTTQQQAVKPVIQIDVSDLKQDLHAGIYEVILRPVKISGDTN